MDNLGVVSGVLLMIVVLAFYVFVIWIPVLIAKNRDHPKLEGVTVMTVLSLFLPFLWPVAMVWAFVGSTSPEEQRKLRTKAMASYKLPEKRTPNVAAIDAELEMATAETCDNCGDPIGKLETPQLWKDHVVCSECLRKLSAAR